MGKGTDYIVEKKEELRRISRAGEPVLFLRIFATSKGGTYFQVEIPEDQLERADAVLTKKAKELDAI